MQKRGTPTDIRSLLLPPIFKQHLEKFWKYVQNIFTTFKTTNASNIKFTQILTKNVTRKHFWIVDRILNKDNFETLKKKVLFIQLSNSLDDI